MSRSISLIKKFYAYFPPGLRENSEKGISSHKEETFYKTMFSEISNAVSNLPKYVHIDKSRHFKCETTPITTSDDLPQPNILHSLIHDNRDTPYFPLTIYKTIVNDSSFLLRFKYNIDNREITIHFIICNSEVDKKEVVFPHDVMKKYQSYAYNMFVWLSIIGKLSAKSCSKTFNAYIYMLDRKKVLPFIGNSIIGPEHVNTGVSRGCISHGEVVIFRQEEWFKVFIHETMHNFGMDFASVDLEIVNREFRSMFTITHHIQLFETYTEVWARIINICMKCYFHNEEEITEDVFVKNVKNLIQVESAFSLYQMVKVLDFMGLDYHAITVINKQNIIGVHHLYRENTNVFAYYIVGAVLMSNPGEFIEWCYTHSRNKDVPIKFTSTSLSYFIDLIRNTYTLPRLIENVKRMEEKLEHDQEDERLHELIETLRMTIITL